MLWPRPFLLRPLRRTRPVPVSVPLRLTDRAVALRLLKNNRARRYILRVRRDGSVVLVIPRGGSLEHGLEFTRRHVAWLEGQLRKTLPSRAVAVGGMVWFRGETVPVLVGPDPHHVTVGPLTLQVRDATAPDLRPEIERHLRRIATEELTHRAQELGGIHGRTAQRITVRNQRTRWGSCSRRGTISLNWRLIQCPDLVRDYIILHELAHLKEMNHSRRFWAEVERLCPEFRTAEQWLRQHASLLA